MADAKQELLFCIGEIIDRLEHAERGFPLEIGELVERAEGLRKSAGCGDDGTAAFAFFPTTTPRYRVQGSIVGKAEDVELTREEWDRIFPEFAGYWDDVEQHAQFRVPDSLYIRDPLTDSGDTVDLYRIGEIQGPPIHTGEVPHSRIACVADPDSTARALVRLRRWERHLASDDADDLQHRLDLAEHSLSKQQKPLFQKLRDMKTHSLDDLATTSQTPQAAEKMVGRIDLKLHGQPHLGLAIDQNGDSILLKQKRRN